MISRDDTRRNAYGPAVTRIDAPMTAPTREQTKIMADRAEARSGQGSRLSSDPWEDLLKNFEANPDAGNGIVRAVDPDGKPEWRVKSCYLLDTVLGLAAERISAVHQRRLGAVMRKLGWTGPKNIRFGTGQAKGYFKAAEDAQL